MSKRVLQVIDQPYRCTIEEQDDPVLWITQAMKGAGGEFGLLLRGSAVNYAVRGQDAGGLRFGDRVQTQPPRIDAEVERLLAKGIPVYFVREDAAERGLDLEAFVSGVKSVPQASLPGLFSEFDSIWHW